MKNEKKSRQSKKHAENQAQEITNYDLLGFFNENRVGDAKLYCRLHRGKVVFVPGWEKFLTWEGHHWGEDLRRDAARLIEDVCQLYENLAASKQEEAVNTQDKAGKAACEAMAESIKRRVNTLRDIPGQDKLLEMVTRVENPLIALPDQFDQHPYLKACHNGVIDLRTGELSPGKPEQYLLRHIQTEYDPSLLNVENPCPETEKYLQSSLDDKEIVDFIWRLLGYGLITKRSDHIFVIFCGEHGRNGKDTLIKLVTHVLGCELSGDVNVDMFLESKQARSSSASAPDIMDLKGMCIAWINEASDGKKFDLQKLKKLSGGGLISARGNYDKFMTKWEQTHLPIMTTNEIPKARAEDSAFWQRALLVKWPFSFVPEPEQPYERPQIKDLDEKLKAEAKGVLARIIRGAVDYFRIGLQIPEKVKEWTREQRASYDDVGQFLDECCNREPYQENPDDYKLRVCSADIYDAFCLWYARNKDKKYSVSAKNFAGMLTKKGIAYKRSNGSWRLGVELTDETLDELLAWREEKRK